MKDLVSKIICSILLILGIMVVIKLAIEYFYGLFIMDDDLMYICSLSLMTIASTVFLLLFLSNNIASLWEKKKNNKK